MDLKRFLTFLNTIAVLCESFHLFIHSILSKIPHFILIQNVVGEVAILLPLLHCSKFVDISCFPF